MAYTLWITDLNTFFTLFTIELHFSTYYGWIYHKGMMRETWWLSRSHSQNQLLPARSHIRTQTHSLCKDVATRTHKSYSHFNLQAFDLHSCECTLYGTKCTKQRLVSAHSSCEHILFILCMYMFIFLIAKIWFFVYYFYTTLSRNFKYYLTAVLQLAYKRKILWH